MSVAAIEPIGRTAHWSSPTRLFHAERDGKAGAGGAGLETARNRRRRVRSLPAVVMGFIVLALMSAAGVCCWKAAGFVLARLAGAEREMFALLVW